MLPDNAPVIFIMADLQHAVPM